jgi:hypothetical protein
VLCCVGARAREAWRPARQASSLTGLRPRARRACRSTTLLYECDAC